MKKTILLAILSFSYNAFAQSNYPTLNLQHPTVNSPENVQGMMGKTDWETSGIIPQMISQQVFYHHSPQPESSFQVVDSIFYWDWNIISNGWIVIYKIIDIEYDNDNNRTKETHQSWNNNTWENVVRHTYTYDVNNNLISGFGEAWSDGTWHNTWLTTFTYDANDNLISELYQEWWGWWENMYQTTYTYDANNNMTYWIFQVWNETEWGNWWNASYTYDSSNNLTIYISQNWNGNAWENESKIIYSYDDNNNMITELNQEWNGSDWQNGFLQTNTYDANNFLISNLGQQWWDNDWENYRLMTISRDADNNIISELIQDWVEPNWMNSYNYASSYDGNNNLIDKLYQIWNGSGWDNLEQGIYTYDAEDFMMGESYKYFDWTSTEIISGDSTHYYYHTEVVGTDDLIVRDENLTVYPNPASDQFSFTLTIESLTQINLEVLNQSGQVIATILDGSLPQGKHKVIWNPENVTSGIYIYRLAVGSQTSTGKLVVIR